MLQNNKVQWKIKKNIEKKFTHTPTPYRKAWKRKKLTKIYRPFKYYFNPRFINKINLKKKLLYLRKKWTSIFTFLKTYLNIHSNNELIKLIKHRQNTLTLHSFAREKLDLLAVDIFLGTITDIQKQILCGDILINGKKKNLKYRVKNLDCISYKIPNKIKQKKFLRRYLKRKKKVSFLLLNPKKFAAIFLKPKTNFKKTLKIWQPKVYWKFIWTVKTDKESRFFTRKKLIKILTILDTKILRFI